MDLNSSKIIDFKLVQKGMLKGDLERKACEMYLEEIIEQGCKIDLFLTLGTKEFDVIFALNFRKFNTSSIFGIYQKV